MRGDHRDALRAVGIATLADLATASPDVLNASGIGPDARLRLQQQAAEQLRERTTGRPSRTLLDPQPGLGLLRLPPPSPGDLHLDFEGDPWFEDGAGIEYLAGLGTRLAVSPRCGRTTETPRGRWSPTSSAGWSAQRRAIRRCTSTTTRPRG
jgi:predicted RecB family nuclease